MPDRAAPELAFVLARGQNAFFGELAEVLLGELHALGVAASLTVGGFPPASPNRIYVLIPPQEYASLESADALADAALLGRTMLICAEQPETPWFDANLHWAASAGAVFDINPRGVAAYQRRGVDAALLPVGYTAAWDTRGDNWDDGRDIDVLFLGARSERREALLARCADVLGRYTSRLVISDSTRPNVLTSEDFVAGADKRALLRRARVLLNLHLHDEPYFEWLRVVEAAHCGAVVVTEHSTGMAPMQAGRDCLTTSALSLPWVLSNALANDERLRRMRRSALETLRDRPMGGAAATLAFTAASLTGRPFPRAIPAAREEVVAVAPPAPAPPARAFPARVHEAPRREDLEILLATPAYRAAAPPDVTVATAVLGQGDGACGALVSVADSIGVRVEVVVVDSGPNDASSATVARWMGRHPDVPALLVRSAHELGLAEARNTALDFARGAALLVLDADKRLSPFGLAQLLAALDDDLGASFSYGMVACADLPGPAQLRNTIPWHARDLAHAKLVDVALIRTSALRAAGGFHADDLWGAFTEARGRLVPSIVGRATGGLPQLAAVR